MITGSTGRLGKSILGFLLKRGYSANNITALARNREKAEVIIEMGINVRTGNYDDADSLIEAFRGVERLMFISGNEVKKRDKQHKNVINAAAETSVKHIIYTSIARKDDDPDSPAAFITDTHIATEKRILNTSIAYTFLRNALYAEGVPMFLGPDIMEKGIFFPAGNGRVPFTAIADIAEAAANVITGQGHENKIYNTVNSHHYSFYEIASILSEITGRNIKYFCPSNEDFAKSLRSSGVQDDIIAGTIKWAEAIKEGCFEVDYSDLGLLLGRKPAGLHTILSQFYPAKQTA